MGQLLLGFRSLILKIAIFVVMAALLAWALGGTLWPRPVVVKYEAVPFKNVEWFWALSVGGERARSDRPANPPKWTMMTRTESDGDHVSFPKEAQPAVFYQVAGPIMVEDRIAFAGELATVPEWATWNEAQVGHWAIIIAHDREIFEAHPMPDRLAVEQQLARLMAGLELQDAATIHAQRSRVIDPVEG
jgi:hypothetical protein